MSDASDNHDVVLPCRRRFLCVLGAGAGVLALGSAGCGGASSSPFTAGAVTSHAVGTFRMFDGSATIVGRDAQGFYAFSSLCTHEGVAVSFSSGASCSSVAGCSSESTTGSTVCAAHHSQFDGNGAVLRGPANSPLPHYQVTLVGGVINVNPGVTVAANTRTAV